MKSHSHRLTPSDSPDDSWIDGSWTVDCSCGVTFDDGEEMVSCDECGVWVHTRCSRFVKGETSFACHNCKKKRSSSAPVADTEETEVAQLLIELPTKTDPCPPPNNPFLGFRLWAKAPMEDRVHVQGVPGGDGEFFKGITSSVFTKQLWKCSGYVPKKFNFQYREFSCWDEKDGGENENENTLSQGADVLFSLSKEVVNSCMPVRAFERTKEGEKVLLQGWGRKERNRLRVFSSKRRKEEFGDGKDWSGKRKKPRSCVDKVVDEFKKRGSVLADDMKKAAASEDTELDVRVEKSEEGKEDGISQHNNGDKLEEMYSDSKPKQVLVIKALKGGITDEAPRKKNALEVRAKVESEDGTARMSSKVNASAAYHEEQTETAEELVKKEDVSNAAHGLKQPKGERDFQGDVNEGSCHVVMEPGNLRNATETLDVPHTHCVPDTGNLPDSNGDISLVSKLHEIDVVTDRDDARDAESTMLLSSPSTDGNLPSMSPLTQPKATMSTSDTIKKQEALSLPSGKLRSRDVDKEDDVNIQGYVKIDDATETGISEPKQHEQAVEESGGSSTANENSFEAGHGSETIEEATIEDSKLSQVTPDVHKSVVDARKDSSTSSLLVISKKPVSTSHKATSTTATSNASKTVHLSKQHRLKMSTFITNKKDISTSSSADEGTRQVPRHSVKTHPKGFDHPRVKSSQVSKSSSKHTSSGSKEVSCEPSLKDLAVASTAVDAAVLSVSCEKIESSQTQNGSTRSKLASTGSCQKNEKLSHPVPQPLSKLLSHSMTMHPRASAGADTTLSDEELALLLHQELNSSPRVPRVTRMRQTSGIQTALQSSPSMLSKRFSHSGGKDQVFRRRNKEEASKGSSCNSHESIEEIKMAARAMSSPNRKYREAVFTTYSSSKKCSRNWSPDTAASMKNTSGDSAECETSSQPSIETRGKNALSIRNSPRDCSEDATRTLPSLIDEILSKHKCLTYEELCDTVCPHWHKVRKPNGDRYAYSSHSHAVLDCLRNRSEWAHLTDRGPKTNSSKRRKHDSDTAAESDNGEAKHKASKEAEEKNDEVYQEDFPKGKRNARKRRQLEVRGQCANTARKRKHAAASGSGIISNDGDKDGDAALSNSSNDASDGLLSEDESQGAEVSISASSGSSR